MRHLFRIALFLVILLGGIAVLAFYWTFYRPLPEYTGRVELTALEAPVEIHWDSYGVPHIYAENESDLYYAIGYVHAQDRLWQMTLSQLAGSGRLSEFLGAPFIEADKYQRTLGFRDTAEKIAAEAPAHLNELLLAYSEGVNTYADMHASELPIEFTLLDINPIEWTPTDSYTLSRLIAWDMNVSWWGEVAYASLESTLSPQLLQELFPVYDDSFPTTMNDEQSSGFTSVLQNTLDSELQMRALFEKNGSAVGSNAWAVDGSKTASGKPMLAGDPHMGLGMPGNWYELHLNLNGRNLSGATIPGAPIVVVGQNDVLAWSMTNMMADDTDFFIELEHPEDTTRFVADSLNGIFNTESFQVRNDIIRVKDSDDILFRIRSTDNGPVISDIYPGGGLPDGQLISMKWTGHRISHELEALYNLNWSTTMEEFQTSLSQYEVPGQNFTYADTSGNIALFSAGRLPIRNHNPLLFRHGWDATYDWSGWIPFEDMPHVVNPPSGWVGNANNKLHTDSYPYYIATFWEPPSRIQRIEEFMLLNDTLSVDVMKEMQLDSYSTHARRILDIVLPVLRQNPGGRDEFSQVTPYLGNWDFRYDLNSTAATLFDYFFMTLTRHTLQEKMGQEAYRNFIHLENNPIRVMSRLIEDDSFLFDNSGTPQLETRNDVIRRSMSETISWLTDEYGPEPFEWRWGNLHTLQLRPPLFAQISDSPESPDALKLIVDNLMSSGPYPVPGHGMSLNKGQYMWENPFDMVLGASIRRIVDFSDPGKVYSVLPTGQSGNPLSDFFGDQTDLWLNGQYRYLYQDDSFFREVSYQTLFLEPSN